METDKKQDVDTVQPAEQNQMTPEQAFDIVKQVCDKFNGTLQDHRLIQTALQILQPEK